MTEMDVVVGMGCEVECPVPPRFKGRRVEWNIPDPHGRELDYYRKVRDLIERQVTALLKDLEAEQSKTRAPEGPSSPHGKN